MIGLVSEVMRSIDMTPAIAAAIAAEADAALPAATAPPARLGLLYLKADLKVEGSEAAAEEAKRLVLEAVDAAPLFRALDPNVRKRAAQDLLASGSPDATERATAVLRSGDVEAADAILDHLKKHRPDVLITFFGELTANPRAFRVLVRNAMFRRVELAATRRYDELGELDGSDGWNADRWRDALAGYYAEHDSIGIDADARGAEHLLVEERQGEWTVRQVLVDPDGFYEWAILATVDLGASDEAGTPVVRVVDVARLAGV